MVKIMRLIPNCPCPQTTDIGWKADVKYLAIAAIQSARGCTYFIRFPLGCELRWRRLLRLARTETLYSVRRYFAVLHSSALHNISQCLYAPFAADRGLHQSGLGVTTPGKELRTRSARPT